MLATYGTKFADAYRGVPLDVIKATWQAGIEAEGLSRGEVTRGVRACVTGRQKWPPMLPEFLALCRPPVDFEADFEVAVEQMRRRDRRADKWPSRALFWAAAAMGGDLVVLPYKAQQKRWARIYEEKLAADREGLLDDVPERPLELPYNPTPVPMPARVREQLAGLFKRTNVTPKD